jgi:cytochrome c1
MRRLILLLAAPISLLSLCSCSEDVGSSAAETAGGSIARGRGAVVHYGCASCHTIPGIAGADALVGPPLDRIASRTYVAGVLVNTPENLVRWIQDPPGVDPLTAMPNLRVNEADARDIATFLSTLR